MKSGLFTRSTCALILAGMLLSGASALADTKIAVANAGKIFSEIKEKKDWEQKMLQDQNTLKDTAFQKQQKVKSLTDQRDNLRTDSPQYAEKDKELQTAKIDFEVWAQIQQAESQRTNKMQTKALFDKIVNAVAEVATAKGIDLVIADQHPEIPDNFMEQATLEQLRALLGQRNVLYSSPQVDITQDVITAMDAKYAAGK
jgi:Skp family chaperone for outer membrane proteins